ncbi:methyl-accepting chemotaxis protein [Alteromonas ponticola]|uniref:Methyl-accepting chemotaxis protein n=1 Tax=Alteromonas aquimaris TaxID=2998417 RepID=A0ABT3P7E4_9ALTE|nr:methyl-accepting chemotaxis protein [Alteromonas aquimaris]MCW8108674.1 methyl-accepting chemotaxis protein [Alteromonas aquimaris]
MQLTVVKKITLGFALFGCLLLLTSILSYFGLNDIRQSAVVVVEEKMPVQAQMVEVKTDILNLARITANGYHESTAEGLLGNRNEFETKAETFVQQRNQLVSLIESSDTLKSAVASSDKYLKESVAMYEAIGQRLTLEAQLATKLEEVLRVADEGSALMLDLSYLDSDDPTVNTLIGAGTTIDNKLLTMNTAISELGTTNDEQVTQNIVEDLKYQLSNLQVDKDYLNRLAQDVDDGGTVAMFNEQYEQLLDGLQGENSLVSLQLQKLEQIAASNRHRELASEALNVALENINTLFENVRQSSLDGQNDILETVQNNLVRNVIVSVFGLIAAAILAVISTRSIARPLARINRGLTMLSKGDLSKKLRDEGNDEFSDLARKVNSLTDNLRELIGNILKQEKQLIAVTKESVSMGERSLQDVDQQREQVQLTSRNTENVQSTSRSNLEQINLAMEKLNSVSKQSDHIFQLVQENRRQVESQASQAEESATIIHRLDQNSRNIGSILDVIKTIAEQTNLLALNAAIEAARAGEQGRGFAVVADEVRTLATRTHDSTEEIESMIGNVQQDAAQAVKAINLGREQAKDGVTITSQVSEQVDDIRKIIEALSQINHHIVDDTRMQDKLLADVADSLNTIVSLADSSAESTRLSNESVMRLDAQVESLKRAVERFTL